MSRVRAAMAAVWEFVVGDDWRTAVGVGVALGVTAVVAAGGTNAWWVMPLSVLALLCVSLWRAARGASRGG
jgi:hypothetical protein